MAIPSGNSYWMTRKGMYEQAIVRHRNNDNDFYEKWNKASNYFKKNNILASVQQGWDVGKSSKSFQNKCLDSHNNLYKKKRNAANLHTRRGRLMEMLMQEASQYEAELKSLSTNPHYLEDMKFRLEGLKSAREEERKQVAKEKLHEHWVDNNHQLREVHSSLMQDHVVENWSEQQCYAKQRMLEEREANAAIEKEMINDDDLAVKLHHKQEEQRFRKEVELQDHITQQIEELQNSEKEAEELKKKQNLLLQAQLEMEMVETERRHKDEQRRKVDLGHALLCQHKTQMMHKSKVMQRELEEDRTLLEKISQQQEEEVSVQTARKEKARTDANWMKQVIEDQLHVEKVREDELDTLFQYEAARMWQTKEAEWERERRARQRLMDEVLQERQKQIEEKLADVRRQQAESLERREALLKQLDTANEMLREEQEKALAEQETFRQDLGSQMDQQKNNDTLLHLNLQQDVDEERQVEDDHLHSETDRLQQTAYTPRFFGRKQALF